ncbi:MAG: dipicolinate synthase subunit B [Clostridia bacterium]|nr:dipicolinate synthase subunit B [Clostridia bacterium]
MERGKACIGFAMTGSFCTFAQVMPQMQRLVDEGYRVLPIMSGNVYATDTRFGRAQDFIRQAETITGESVIHTIAQAEPIGPQRLLDLLLIAPCTGNTLGKLAAGIYDTAPTLAFKSHRRNDGPVLIALSTNDALAASGGAIGSLMNRKGVYFVPFGQDDREKKPTSCVADFDKILPAVRAALAGRQLQPVLF